MMKFTNSHKKMKAIHIEDYTDSSHQIWLLYFKQHNFFCLFLYPPQRGCFSFVNTCGRHGNIDLSFLGDI